MDDNADAWHHADECQRRRAEDEALDRARDLTEQLRRETKEFERSTKSFWDRLLRLSRH